MAALLFDFARVILFPKDKSYTGNLNALHQKLSTDPEYVPLDHFVLNTELLKYLSDIKEKIGLYIFTSETIQVHPAFALYLMVFKKIFSSSKLNMTKTQPEAYRFIAEQIGLPPQKITFIDDTKENIDTADSIGMNGILYVSNTQLFGEFEQKRGILL